jgi:GR25 family glycosyltransferase involved in LPS biosynthesis
MESEIARFGLADRYRRMQGIADPDGGRGCYHSHMKALQEARHLGGIVHILEDDSILSSSLEPFLIDKAPALLERFDIVFLDMWVEQNSAAIARYEAAAKSDEGLLEFGAGGPRIACTSSYIVAASFAGKLQKRLRYLDSGHTPVDAAYDHLARDGEIKAAAVVPFLTGVDLKVGVSSDVQAIPSAAQRMFVLLRTRFFVDKERQPTL